MRHLSLRAVFVLAFAALAFANAPSAHAVTVVKWPYLLWVTETEAIIMWETTAPAEGTVTLTPTSGGAPISLAVPATDTVQQARVTGLTPGTRYAFVVKSGTQTLGDGAFTTDSRAATKVVFGAIGDNQTYPAIFLNLNNRMMRHNPELIINSGDIMTDGLVLSQWDTEFFTPNRNVLRYAPCYVSMGNHEQNSPYFRRYLPYPETMTGNPVDSRGHYYWYRRGNAVFIALDQHYPMGVGSAQYNWLVQTLSRAEIKDATWRIAYSHKPGYTVGWSGYTGEAVIRDTILPLLERNNFDIWISGHTHSYERGLKNGIIQIINGGGGGGNEDFGRNVMHIVRFGLIYEYSIAKIDGDTLEWSCYDNGDFLFDRFTLKKGVARDIPGAPVFKRQPQNGRVGKQMVRLTYPEGGSGRFFYRVAVKERLSEDGYWEPTPVMYRADKETSLPIEFKSPGAYHVIAQALDAEGRATEWTESQIVTISP